MKRKYAAVLIPYMDLRCTGEWEITDHVDPRDGRIMLFHSKAQIFLWITRRELSKVLFA